MKITKQGDAIGEVTMVPTTEEGGNMCFMTWLHDNWKFNFIYIIYIYNTLYLLSLKLQRWTWRPRRWWSWWRVKNICRLVWLRSSNYVPKPRGLWRGVAVQRRTINQSMLSNQYIRSCESIVLITTGILVSINKAIPNYSFYRLLERKTQMGFTGANVEIAPGMCLVIWYQRSKLMMSGW